MLLPAWLSHDMPLWDLLSDWLFASGAGRGGAPSAPLCSTESVPDGCDLWTSQNGGTNERCSTCVRDGGTVFDHHSVFEEGVSDIAS